MLAVVHCEDEKDIRFHNPYRRQNISRTEYDPDTTFPLVLGPQGTLSASVRTALQLVSHDGSIHLPAGSSMNPTDSDFHISERFVWEQFLRGLRRSGFDTIADLGILAGGKGERRAWVPGEDQCRLEVTPLHFPIVVHRSSRALISTSSLTVSQLYKAFQNHELEATGVRGLSDDDIERFFDLLNRESAVKALGGSQSAQEAKTKSKNTPPQHEKPKLVRRMQRYIGRV